MEIKLSFFNDKFRKMNKDSIAVYLVMRGVETELTKFMKTRGQFVSNLSIEKLAKYTGLSETTVEVCLQELEENGWIKKRNLNNKEMWLLGEKVGDEMRFFSDKFKGKTKEISLVPLKPEIKGLQLTPLSDIISKDKAKIDELIHYFIAKYEDRYRIAYNRNYQQDFIFAKRILKLTCDLERAKAYIDLLLEKERGIIDLKRASSRKLFLKYHSK